MPPWQGHPPPQSLQLLNDTHAQNKKQVCSDADCTSRCLLNEIHRIARGVFCSCMSGSRGEYEYLILGRSSVVGIHFLGGIHVQAKTTVDSVGYNYLVHSSVVLCR